jgi:anti-anti-sigma factor
MEITTNEVAGITVVYICGEIKSTTAGEVMDSLVDLVKGGVTKLLVNVKDVEFISSAGLRSILVASKLLKNTGGELRLCNANETVAKVLETSGFTSLVSMHSDESAAIAAFK